MENMDFKISFKTVWVLVVGNILLTIIAVFAKIQHWEFSQLLLTVSLILFFSSWIITFSDIVSTKIYHKKFWILYMFVFPSITPLIYLVQRKRLIYLGTKLL